MSDRDRRSSSQVTDPYSPLRRTALVLTGTGTAGAYHAGVLRALHEAGVKIDIVAGRGIGVVGALFAAVDGAQRLWDDKGFWRAPAVDRCTVARVPRSSCGRSALSLAIVAVPIARGARPDRLSDRLSC
jgi:predicted acylesterase/phospholipase RssA